MSDDDRPWTQHLRMLPGGDADVASALIATGILYLVLLGVGSIASYFVTRAVSMDFGPISWFSLANSLPCTAIALWTGVRVRSSKHIGREEAAADLIRRRVFYGDEVARVPKDAVVFSVRPRQVTVTMADERPLVLFFRVNSDPEDVLALGGVLKYEPGLAVEDWVHREAQRTVGELLPDPTGCKDALTTLLLPHGIVVTRAELG